MKELKKGTLCLKCLGCNRLINEKFEGIYRCNNFMKGVENNVKGIRKDKNINE